ncbi:hypothetical protein ACIQC7_34815 [Kitasatospora sp. NPDC088556]|uniref:hypothetical protein n=1 Tax=Kitasatospora sp. NPDC088556 TaxID=3364076 RepID=UPI00381DE62D
MSEVPEAAEAAAARLKAALARHGITLPSLGAYPYLVGPQRTPMVELGGTTVEVARRLAEVLEELAAP